MENFRTILDLFIYVDDKNMCTNLYCTTCGAMDYRNMCKYLGFTRIKELIEATTEEDFLDFLQNNPSTPWIEPFKILLHDGFRADPQCFMMSIYDEGAGIYWYGRVKELLMEINGVKVYAVSGNVFRSYGCEVIAIFNRYRLEAVSYDSYDLLAAFHNSEEGVFFTKDNMPESCRALYCRNMHRRFTDGKELYSEVESFIVDLLHSLSLNRYKSVSMNGLVTYGYSELDNVKFIINWIKNNPCTSIEEIVLVDKDGGFNRLKNNADFKIIRDANSHVK